MISVGDIVRLNQDMTWANLNGYGPDEIVLGKGDLGTVRWVRWNGSAVQVRWRNADTFWIVGPEVLEAIR